MGKKSFENTTYQRKNKSSSTNHESTDPKTSILPAHLRDMIKKRIRTKKHNSRSEKVTPTENAKEKQQIYQEVLYDSMKEDQLNCPICLDLCIFPVSTECGHFYCLPCFEEFHQSSTRCCVCRS